MRKTLSLKSAASTEPSFQATPAVGIIEAAILRRLCVRATYNRTDMQFAPHILYTRHDDPFVDGVVTEREGKPPREIKLASFKLAGLTGLTLTTERFEPQSVFVPGEARYAGVTLSAIRAEPVSG
ncbi:hypothetical protein [Sphingomonas profundi]|uniref:hypothetical protein n=1 Tax=Alterirhizorhabdus profundi TaxID=2681549 RepID=UPI001E5CB7E8|nr:hypothetical protein [Sphingomonas profundi]